MELNFTNQDQPWPRESGTRSGSISRNEKVCKHPSRNFPAHERRGARLITAAAAQIVSLSIFAGVYSVHQGTPRAILIRSRTEVINDGDHGQDPSSSRRNELPHLPSRLA